MNRELVPVLPRLVGKTIAHIVVKEGSSPQGQIFLVFTDDTYYEFYVDATINGASGLDGGGLPAALAYMSPQQAVVFQC